MHLGQANTRVSNCDMQLLSVIERGADSELARPLSECADCFHAVHDEIEYDLLQLHAIAISARERRVEVGPQCHTVLAKLPGRERENLADDLVQVEQLPFIVRLPGERSDSCNHLMRAACIRDDTLDCLYRLVNVRNAPAQPAPPR